MDDPLPRQIPEQRNTFFYGWVILGIAICAQILTAPGQTVGVSEFNGLYANRLEMSARTVAIYYCFGTALGSIGLPFFGVIIDRLGCRIALTLVAFLLATTCFFCGRVRTPLELLAAFTFLRMFGQGALSLVASTMVSLWFKRHLAFAYAVMSVGSGLGMMSVPYVFGPIFENNQFVEAFQWISLGVFALVPVAIVLVVNHPQSIGRSQDGDPTPASELEANGLEPTSESGSTSPAVETAPATYDFENFTFIQAISTSAFWIVAIAQSAWALIGTGLVYNRKTIFGEIGATDGMTDLAVPGLFCAMIISQLMTGFVAARLGHAVLFTLGCLGMAGACGLILLQMPATAFAGFLLFGFAQGIFLVMGQTLWADYYGRTHIGRIRGFVWMIVVLASSLGGFALTLDYESSFPFRPIWYAAITMVVLGLACTQIRRPER